MNPEVEVSLVEDLLRELEIGDGLYCAGKPGYESNFSRDSIIYALLAQDLAALENQIKFSAYHQGNKADSLSGEEAGKIHHELPGVRINGKLTTYNACDTTALFLLGLSKLSETKPELLAAYITNIDRACEYIDKHVVDGIFFETPRWCGGKNFALKVTYWKDSAQNGFKPEATYPVAYALPHFQNAAALLGVGEAIGDSGVISQGNKMFQRGIDAFWKDDHFVSSIDGEGYVCDPPSSDSLHCLAYIPPEIMPEEKAEAIGLYSQNLETAFGYRAGLPNGHTVDRYHTDYVWVFEQAFIHMGALNYGLERVEEEALQVAGFLKNSFAELVGADDHMPVGNNPQLWSIGAYKYFKQFAAL